MLILLGFYGLRCLPCKSSTFHRTQLITGVRWIGCVHCNIAVQYTFFRYTTFISLFEFRSFVKWAIFLYIWHCVIFVRPAQKYVEFRGPTQIHWPNFLSKFFLFTFFFYSEIICHFSALCRVRIILTKWAHGYHFRWWPHAFRPTCLHLPVSIRWQSGRWASTRTTRLSSKIIHDNARQSFRLCCKKRLYRRLLSNAI